MVRSSSVVILICLAATGPRPAPSAAAQAQLATVEVPIREVDLSDGTRRYSVTIRIDGRTVDAALDSGSVGLRVLPGFFRSASIKQVGPVQRYGFGTGTTLEGPVVQTALSVGALQGASRWQAVRTIGCSVVRPNCPASHIDPTKFGIQGDGYPGEGFLAILGVGLAKADLPNPIQEIGAHRWIIELPRPGEASAGRLILNPGDEQVAGFTSLPLADVHTGRADDAVLACLLHDGGKPICAPTLIDSGAPGIELVNRRVDGSWNDGTPTRLIFGAPTDAPVIGVRFDIGRRTQASRFNVVTDSRVNGARIRSGLLAYFAFDVLYDADHGTISVKSRPAYPEGATAI